MTYESNSIFAFLMASFVTVASPGPSTLFIIQQAGAGGLRAGLAAIAGILLADAIFLLAGALGVGAALAAAPKILFLINLFAAAYFAFLSYRMAWPHFRVAFSGHGVSYEFGAIQPLTIQTATARDVAHRAFVMHFVNTEALMFFGMLVPQFIDPRLAFAPQVILLLGLHLSVAVVVLGAYAAFGAAVLPTPAGKKLAVALDLIGAAVMLGLSVSIVVSLLTEMGATDGRVLLP